MGLSFAGASASAWEESTSFVGRRSERKQARGLLGTSRLLTITGTGGVGKTRLAVELVREVARTFDEVWLVELGTLAPSESVPDAIASAIGFHSLGSDITAELGEFIAERKALLILDGCEHVLEQCATFVVTLLRLCPALRILATSRAPLRLTHEAVLLVGTLPTPRKHNRHTSLTTSPAVRLFLDRAARAHDGIDYHQDDLLAIADICRQLDGLPLAIELAAARVKALSPAQIRDRLRESHSILSGGYRDTPRRQQSITLAIDWSYRLCSPDEQRMWREMSVYVGGWDLAAAEWVAGTERSAASTLDIVQSLLEKSILVRRQSAGTTWYSMLGTIREFGLSRLKAESALARVQEQHREWYRQLLHRAEEEWIGADQPAWLALLRRELPNIRNALVFCIQSLDGAAALDLTLTAWRIRWQPDARIDELRRWLLRALALPGSDGTPNRAQAFALLAVIENGQGDRAAAMRHLAEARRIAVALDDPYTTSCVDTAEAELETDPDRAVSLYRAAIAVQPNTGEIVARVDPSTRLALFYDRIGRASEARVLRNRILDVLARRGEQYEASYLLMHAGAFAAERGELDAAIELSRAALKLKRTLVNPVGVAHIEEVLASVAVQRRQYGRAATLLGSAASERQEVGDLPSSFSSLVENLGELTETARKSLGSDAFDRAVERGRALTHDEGIAFALEEPAEHATAKAIEPPRDVPTLTPREEEVAALVARGLSDREIASELVVSLRTAQGHVQRILVKLGLTSRTQLAAWYLTSFPQTEGWESA